MADVGVGMTAFSSVANPQQGIDPTIRHYSTLLIRDRRELMTRRREIVTEEKGKCDTRQKMAQVSRSHRVQDDDHHQKTASIRSRKRHGILWLSSD
jgi:hypothetical protein